MTLDEFEQLPLLTTLFPITFMTGRQKFTHFTLHCNDCGKPIADDQTRGTIGPVVEGYRSIVTKYELDVYGICGVCNSLTRAFYIACDDMTVAEVDRSTGELRHRWRLRKATFFERIWDFFKKT